MGNCVTSTKLNLGENAILEINHSMQDNVQDAAMKLLVMNQNRHMYTKDDQRRIRHKLNEVGNMLEHDLRVPNPDQAHFKRPEIKVNDSEVNDADEKPVLVKVNA